jgi:hypothetical protein
MERSAEPPLAMISLWLADRQMQVVVAADGADGEGRVMEVTYDDPAGPFRYAARVRPSVHRPVIEAVTVSVKPDALHDETTVLNRKVLAAVPLAQLLRGAQAALDEDLQGWGNTIKRWPPPPKGHPYPNEHYEQVAGAYRAAITAGQSPRPFIRETWQVSGATVSRWIRQARELGLLEPAAKAMGGRPRRSP